MHPKLKYLIAKNSLVYLQMSVQLFLSKDKSETAMATVNSCL